MTIIKCSCDKVLEEIEDGSQEIKYIQHPLACKECRRNHACCVRFSPAHAIDLLEQSGYKITK